MNAEGNPYTRGNAAHAEVCAYCTQGMPCADAEQGKRKEAEYASDVASAELVNGGRVVDEAVIVTEGQQAMGPTCGACGNDRAWCVAPDAHHRVTGEAATDAFDRAILDGAYSTEHGAALKARVQAMVSGDMRVSVNPYGDHDGVVIESAGEAIGYVEYNGSTWDAELPDTEGEEFAALEDALSYLTTDLAHEIGWAHGYGTGPVPEDLAFATLAETQAWEAGMDAGKRDRKTDDAARAARGF